MPLADELRKIVRGEVEDAPQALEKYSRDASLFRVAPQVVVYPKDANDICRLVRFVNQQKTQNSKLKISLTARAAGTDMSGGPLNTSIIVDTSRHLNSFLQLGENFAVVEPGMYFRDFDKATKEQGLELPSYTASREFCAVGGMVGNDAGGEKNLKYGKTARYVEELEVVLADGGRHVLRDYQGEALIKKLQKPGFEGDLYRSVAKLVASHQATIQANKPHVEKNSSGYPLWDIGDGKKSLNLARLMVGAQGTLGIITKIKFKLVRPKPFSAMAVMFVSNLEELGYLVPEVLKHRPDSFESYDDHVILLTAKYLPELAAQMKLGLIGVAIKFFPEVWMALTGGIPKIVLLAEFRAETQEEALAQAEKLKNALSQKKSRIKIALIKNEQAAQKYWIMRRETFNLLRKKVRGLRTAPFIDDFVVPPETLPEFLPKLNAMLAEYRFTYAVSGHVGDGNFHIFPLVDPKDPKTVTMINELSHRVYDLVFEYKGSITGEHNDGLIRTPYVQKMFGREMYGLFLDIKQYFDPRNIFNPGKKVGSTFSDTLPYLDLRK